MRTKDELFREAQRHIAARRQRAVTEAARRRAPPSPPTRRWPKQRKPAPRPAWP